MKRRTFTAAMVAAAATWPAWLRRGFAAGDRCPPEQAGTLEVVAAAYRRAQRRGKPLLALVIPGDPALLFERGEIFGELLNHGGDDALATMALAEVACVRWAALATLAPAVGQTDALMVLVETDGVPARARRVEAAVEGESGIRAQARRLARSSWEQRMAEEAALVDRRIEAVAGLVKGALLEGGLAARERQAEAQLGAAAAALRARLAAGEASPAELDGGAAIALGQAAALPLAGKRRAISALAEAARLRLCRKRVPGSRWASAGGCGVSIEYEPGEKEPDHMVACGMGHVPAKSQRMLEFFTRRS